MYSNKDALRTGRVVEFVAVADDCTCDRHGYCPVHGTYTPVVATDTDGEVMSTVRHVPPDRRIVRKKVGEG